MSQWNGLKIWPPGPQSLPAHFSLCAEVLRVSPTSALGERLGKAVGGPQPPLEGHTLSLQEQLPGRVGLLGLLQMLLRALGARHEGAAVSH